MAASGEIYQATFQGLLNGAICENVLHFRALNGSVTQSQINAGIERFWFLTQGIQCNSYVYNNIIIKRMTPIALDEINYVPTTVSHGSGTGGCMQNTIAAIMTLRTGTAGKSHRGRIYFAGLADGMVNAGGNTLSTAGAVLFASTATNLVSEFGPSGANTAVALGIYSRTIGGIHPFSLAGWQQVSTIDIQTILGNQRRRRLGVGI
jgi:hypothetical protein